MDWLVAIFLLVFGALTIILQIYEISAMHMLAKKYIGFRFLLHGVVADMCLIFAFGVWQGIVIIFNSEITTPDMRIFVNIFTNTVWWASAYFSLLVCVTRFACVQWPVRYQTLSIRSCYYICAGVWIVSLLQATAVNFIPGFERLHFSPGHLGQTANWAAYVESFTRIYYMTFNFGTISITLLLYAIVAYQCRRQLRKLFLVRAQSRVFDVQRTGSSPKESHELSVEYRLIVPSAISAVLAIAAQLLIVCDIFPREWQEAAANATFMIMIIFNSLPRLLFSHLLRRAMIKLLNRHITATTAQPKDRIFVITNGTLAKMNFQDTLHKSRVLAVVPAANDHHPRKLAGTIKLLVSNNDLIGISEKYDQTSGPPSYWCLSEQAGVAMVCLEIEGTMLPTEIPVMPNLILPLAITMHPERCDPAMMTQLLIRNVCPTKTNVDLTPVIFLGPFEVVNFEDMKATATTFVIRILERLKFHKCVVRLDITRSHVVRSLLEGARDIFCQNQCSQLRLDRVSYQDNKPIDSSFIQSIVDEWILPTWTADHKLLVITPNIANSILCTIACGYRTKILRSTPLYFFIWHPDYEGIIVVEQDEANHATNLNFRKRIDGPYDDSFYRYLLSDTL